MRTRNKTIFPYLIAATVGLFILFLAWAANHAATGGTDVTDRDYYSKGLKYNSTLVEKRAASVIGWKLQAELEPGILKLVLFDKEGDPVSGANGRVVFPEPGSNHARVFTLAEGAAGIYRLAIPADLTGEKLARIEFEREGARISRQLLINIPGASGTND